MGAEAVMNDAESPKPTLKTFCYLCGSSLAGEPHSYDHVPPIRFFPRRLRARGALQLLRLPAHLGCNRQFQADEEFFFARLVPIAAESSERVARDALEDLLRCLRRPAGRALVISAGYEIDATREFGPALVRAGRPDSRRSRGNQPISWQSADVISPRLHRVVWKIVRGLAWARCDSYVPQDAPHTIQLVLPDGVPAVRLPARWETFVGDDEGAFAFSKEAGSITNVWQLQFWTQIRAVVHVATVECLAAH